VVVLAVVITVNDYCARKRRRPNKSGHDELMRGGAYRAARLVEPESYVPARTHPASEYLADSRPA
jgi:hypothetical protein